MVVSFTIPGAPHGKGRPRIGRVGAHARMFTPVKTANYESLVALAAQAAMAAARAQPFTGAVGVNLFIDCQVPASWSGKKQRAALAGDVLPGVKPDIDNCCKAVFDGLNGVLWRDDAQVVDTRIRKRYAAVPCVRVEVWPLDATIESTVMETTP